MIITAGKTDVTVDVYFVDDDGGTAPGEPTTGKLFSDIETGGSASYHRQGAARVDFELFTQTAAGAHTDGGFVLIDDTNMPGLYRLDVPDAAFVTGADYVVIQCVMASGNNSIMRPLLIDLTDVDLRDAVSAGLSRLDAAITTRLAPTTGGRTLDILATGEVPIDFDTSIGSLAAGQIEAGALDGKGNWNIGKTGYALTQAFPANFADMSITVTAGLVDITQAAADKSWGTAARVLTANTNLNDPTAATIADAVWDEPIEDHDTQGNMGWMAALGVYAGSDGPGVYIDSGAANTNTVVGTDGTVINPVSTFAAARTIADDIGVKIYYLEGNSDITLAATHVDWEFIGIGSVSDNIVNLGSQDVSRSLFRNLTVEGTQGGAGRITARDCALQDPGAGDTTLHIFAERCGFVDRIQIDTSNDNVFDQCFSLVAGTAAPVIQATGASGTLSIRHYSGGLEFETLSASHNVTWEGIGQVIFNADCNVNANVSVRGIASITDNTAGMNSLTETSMMNMTKVNAEVVDVLKTDTVTLPGQEAPPLTPTFEEMISWLYKVLRNRKDQNATLWQLYADDESTVDAKATVSSDGTTAVKQEIVAGS